MHHPYFLNKIMAKQTLNRDYPENSGKQLSRKVTIRSNDKDIPPLHIHTNLITLETDYKTFLKEIKNI